MTLILHSPRSKQSHFPSSVSREKSVFSARYPGFKRFSSSAPPKSSTFVPKKTSRFFPSSAAENSHIATSFSSAKSGSSSLHQQSSFSQPNSRNTDAVSSSPSNRIIHPISTSTQSHLFLSSHPLAPKETFLDSVAGKSPNSPIFSSRKDRSPPAFEPSISLDSFHRTSHFSPLSAANFISPYNKLPAPSNVNRWHHVYSEHFDGPTFHDLPTLDPSKISSTKHKIEAKYLDNYRPHKVLRNLYEIESTPHNENHIISKLQRCYTRDSMDQNLLIIYRPIVIKKKKKQVGSGNSPQSRDKTLEPHALFGRPNFDVSSRIFSFLEETIYRKGKSITGGSGL